MKLRWAPGDPGRGGERGGGLCPDSFEGPQRSFGCLQHHQGQGGAASRGARLPSPQREPAALAAGRTRLPRAGQRLGDGAGPGRGGRRQGQPDRGRTHPQRTRHAPAPDWIEGVLRRRPLGVVLVFSSLPAEVKQRLRSWNIPFVIVDPAVTPDPDVPSSARPTGPGAWRPPATSPTTDTNASRSSRGSRTCCAHWPGSTATARR